MKLSEINGPQTLDVIADIIPPITRIADDKECMALFTTGGDGEGQALVLSRLGKAVPAVIKAHKDDVIAVLAAVNCTTPEKYAETMTIPKLIADTYEIMTDESLLAFFG